MSSKRRDLKDALAEEFVYGNDEEDLSLPTQESDLMSKLTSLDKEPTVRLSVDLPFRIHKKLTILAAKTGKKKAEIVRLLINEALNTVPD